VLGEITWQPVQQETSFATACDEADHKQRATK